MAFLLNCETKGPTQKCEHWKLQASVVFFFKIRALGLGEGKEGLRGVCQRNLSDDTFSIEAPQNLLRTNVQSHAISGFSSLVQKTYLWRFYSLLFRGIFVAFPWLFRGPFLSRKTVFGPFSWLFRGFFVAFSWLFRGFFVALVLGKIYAYSP